METADAELEERTEEGHFLRANLTAAQKGDGLRAMLINEGLKAHGENLEGLIPIDGIQPP